MSLSKETEVVFGVCRSRDCDSANPPLCDSPTSHRKVLGGETQYDYTRSGNPNQALLEEKLARLEGGKYGFAYASGIATIPAVLLTLSAGNHIILLDDVYGDIFRLTEQILDRLSIEFTTVNATYINHITEAIQSNARLIHAEAPSNLLFKITDIHAVAMLAEERKILLTVDNTSMTLLGQPPLALGTDIAIHSTTKFLDGHSDLIAGVAITNNREVANALYLLQDGTGIAFSTYDSWAFVKHLKTLPVHSKQSARNAERLVQFLDQREKISEVYYPGDNLTHLKQASTGGAVTGFRLENKSKAQGSVDSLALLLVSVSPGGVEIILSHSATVSHTAMPEDTRRERSITFELSRLGVGLENSEELIIDFNYVLKEAFSESFTEPAKEQRFSS